MARRKADPPGTADPPEGTPAARDGSPDEDELARRRAAKGGESVAERVQNGDGDEPELFKMGSLDGDPKVTLKNLIKAGSTVSVKASLSSAEVPVEGGGLFDPEEEILLLVRALPGGVTPRPKHGGEKGDPRRPIKEWTLSQAIAVTHVQAAGELVNRVQVVDVLSAEGVASGTVSKVLAALFGEEPEAAQA